MVPGNQTQQKSESQECSSLPGRRGGRRIPGFYSYWDNQIVGNEKSEHPTECSLRAVGGT